MAEFIDRDKLLYQRPPRNDSHKPGYEDYDEGWNDCWEYFTSLIRGQDAADVAMIIHAKIEVRGQLGFYHRTNCGKIAVAGKYCIHCGAIFEKEEKDG